MERVSNKLHNQGALTMIIMGVIFAGLALKLEKVGPKSNFKCFVFEFQSMSIFARKRQETVLMPKYSLK